MWLRTLAELVVDSIETRAGERRRLEVLQHAYEARKRDVESVDVKLGAIAVVAVTLMAVYVPCARPSVEHAVVLVLAGSTALALAGSLLFRGYGVVDVLAALHAAASSGASSFTAYETAFWMRHAVSRHVLLAKSACALLSAIGTIAVLATIVVTRWH